MTNPSPFATWSDEVLLAKLHAVADTCVRVTQMSEKDRHHRTDKRVSPEQAGAFSAVCAFAFARELERRGVDTGLSEAKA